VRHHDGKDGASISTTWAAQQLTEFLGAVSGFGDEERAIRGATERLAEIFQAEAAAVIDSRGVVACTGFGPRGAPLSELRRIGAQRGGELEVPGVGPCAAIVNAIDDSRLEGLILARHAPPFAAEERNLANGLARVLGLTVSLLRAAEKERALRRASEEQREENARLLESLRERKRLLERLSRIQGSIVSRSDLDEVFEGIVEGAAELLGDETVALRLIDPEDPTMLVMVASAGINPELLRDHRRSPIGLGAGGRAAAEGEPVTIEDYAVHGRALPAFAADGIRAALAAPVRERGEVVGSLVVATHRQGRRYSAAEREMLLAFAEHASLALTDAKTVEDALQQALHDSLTGLPNRVLLRDRLDQALERAARTGGGVAALFIDLDAFKTVNDSLGHAAGDELLVEAARRLLACVRASDTAARFGGDEFVVLLEDADDHQVARIAGRILEQLEAPFEIRGRELLVGASIGIAMSGEDDDDLLRNADLALYRAKARGGGHSQVYEPRMHAAVVERIELESALAKAMREDELVLHYQPIFDLAAGTLMGIEALLRWRHPRRGMLLPGEFVPVAEGGRLMVPLGRWVLRTACEQAGRWAGAGPLTLSVNVSSAQLHDPSLPADVTEALARSGLPPERLVLELTETAFLSDAEGTVERFAVLKELGVRLAVAAFGTGNASLRHLARLPVDVLKIDRSFVAQVNADGAQAAIARSIIDLGDNLELTVVAEGIETAAQQRELVLLGCRFGQGFHLARPAALKNLGAGPASVTAAHPRALRAVAGGA
jgi:diguanylate cyclase (GGDEF)-like protein